MDRLATGTGRCSGWSYVTTGPWSGWVRDRYLADSPPPTPINLNTHWVARVHACPELSDTAEPGNDSPITPGGSYLPGRAKGERSTSSS